MKNWSYKNFLIYQFEEIASTNDKAIEMAGAGHIFDRTIILADAQSAGRGRMDRAWTSPKGNLYFSLVLQPKASITHIAQLSFLAIAALRLATEAVFDDKIAEMLENKWPNDLLFNGKKIAGLLLESKFNQKNCDFVVLGIGVNIVSNPQNTIFPATNLRDCGVNIAPQDLLRGFLDQFEILYQNWLNFGFAAVRKLWLARAYNLKKTILVDDGREKISGIFDDLDEGGALVLLTKDGLRKITAADVFG